MVSSRTAAAAAARMTDRRPGDFNQAIMGLGNMVCVPVKPKCDQCPVRAYCRAEQEGAQAEIPNLPPKPEKKNLSVEQLLALFSKASGSNEADDKLLLS